MAGVTDGQVYPWIAIALQPAAHPASMTSLSAADAHRLEGIAVYFGGLVLLHELVCRLDRRACAHHERRTLDRGR